jgi:hypothetical protein
VQFFADGTFVDNKALDQLVYPWDFGNPRPHRGTYSIQDQTMLFTLADNGQRRSVIFYAPKAQEHSPMFDFIGFYINILYEEHHRNDP